MVNKITLILALVLIYGSQCDAQTDVDFKGETVKFNASDGVIITADLYKTLDDDAPLIILYHQARYSRGEYRSIAPKLNKLGFNCLAIDQRSGNEVNGVINETNREAVKLKKGTEYVDAIPDVEAAITFAKDVLQAKKVIIWGSSYSAALVFYLGGKYAGKIDGIIAFSPGRYFKIDSKGIDHYSVKVTCPVFITSTKSEHKQWEGIYNTLKSEKEYYLPENEGIHGSRALWSINEGHEGYWEAVEEFIVKLKK